MSDGEFVRHGDFRVPKEDKARAEEVFEDRSPRSQAADKALRGPITTDVERYAAANGRIFDYPGVDTPTDTPRQTADDFPFPDERSQMARDELAMLAPESRSSSERRREDIERMGKQGRSIMEAIWPDE